MQQQIYRKGNRHAKIILVNQANTNASQEYSRLLHAKETTERSIVLLEVMGRVAVVQTPDAVHQLAIILDRRQIESCGVERKRRGKVICALRSC